MVTAPPSPTACERSYTWPAPLSERIHKVVDPSVGDQLQDGDDSGPTGVKGTKS